MDPRLVVVRDQFALRRLSDDALRRIVPALTAAQQQLIAEIEAVLAGGPERAELAWFLTRRRDTLAIIQAQLAAVGARLGAVLPDAALEAYEQGMAAAEAYLEGVTAVEPEEEAPAEALRRGEAVEAVVDPQVAGPTEQLATRTQAEPRPYRRPAITEQQIEAVRLGRGFDGFPGLGYDLPEAIARWTTTTSAAVQKRLEAGFLLGRSNSEIVAEVRALLEGETRAQAEAIVRTSMMTASQAAHDAFYAANADALGDKDGNRYRWDASNDGRLCSRCAPLDDTRYRNREDVPRHPAHFNCRCVVLPITPISDMLDPGAGSFLESTPARDANGKRIPAPAGYGGPNAYRRPRKINGEWRWVRRRDMPAGRTTAGDMLLRANDQTKHDVLGSWSRVEQFKALTAPGRRYRDDPQQAVIELLRPDAARRLPP
jgi:SPP1 gp7 family putative phage head morphogenesis protein